MLVHQAADEMYREKKKANNGRLPHQWMQKKVDTINATAPGLGVTRDMINARERSIRVAAGEIQPKQKKSRKEKASSGTSKTG